MIDVRKQIIFSIIDRILEDKQETDEGFGKGVGLPKIDRSVFEYVDSIIDEENPPK